MTAPAGWRLAPLDPARDGAAVSALFAAAADYVILETGEPPGPQTTRDFFEDAPPGRTAADSDRLGLRDVSGRLIGLVELARGYPDADTWYLGLMLLRPEARGAGAGTWAAAEAAARARAGGARRLMLATLEENAAGRRFWARQGFAEVRRTPPRRRGAKDHVLVEMARDLA